MESTITRADVIARIRQGQATMKEHGRCQGDFLEDRGDDVALCMYSAIGCGITNPAEKLAEMGSIFRITCSMDTIGAEAEKELVETAQELYPKSDFLTGLCQINNNLEDDAVYSLIDKTVERLEGVSE